jgi:hypothetical protein
MLSRFGAAAETSPLSRFEAEAGKVNLENESMVDTTNKRESGGDQAWVSP